MIPKKFIVMSGLSIFALGYCTSNCFHTSPAPVQSQSRTVLIEPEHVLSLKYLSPLEQKIAAPDASSPADHHQQSFIQPSLSQQPHQQLQQQPAQQTSVTANQNTLFQNPLQESQRPYQPPVQEPLPLKKPETKEQYLLRRIGELQHLYRRKVSQLLPYENALPHSSFHQQPQILQKMKRTTQEYRESISKEAHRCYNELKAFFWKNVGGGN